MPSADRVSLPGHSLSGSKVPPGFPVEAFPAWLAEYVAAIAEETQTPPDLPAMLALSILATAAAKRGVLKLSAHYDEPLSLWTVVCLRPGNRKTAVLSRMTAPLRVFEREWHARSRAEVANRRSKRRMLEQTLDQLEREMARRETKAAGHLPDLHVLDLNRRAAAAELETFAEPVLPRLLAEDATPESLGSLLAAQGGRIAIFSDEGGPFEQMAGRYSTNHAPNLEVYLKSDSGSEIRVDRRGRPPEHVLAPALTFGLAVQPDVIRGMAGRPGFRGRGLLGRFLYAVPKETLGTRRVNPPVVPSALEADFQSHVLTLLCGAEAVVEEPSFSPTCLTLSPDGKSALDAFSQFLEPQLAEDGELGWIADWASKLVGKVSRIAALLHLARCGSLPASVCTVSRADVEAAVSIGKYLIDHARAAFGEMDADPVLSGANAILRFVESRRLSRFSRRDLHVGLRSRFTRAYELDSPLAMLQELGQILRLEPPEPGERGGRPPSPMFELVEPRACQAPQNSSNRGSVDSVLSRRIEGDADGR